MIQINRFGRGLMQYACGLQRSKMPGNRERLRTRQYIREGGARDVNEVHKSALVASPVESMFDLIEAAEHYPDFGFVSLNEDGYFLDASDAEGLFLDPARDADAL